MQRISKLKPVKLSFIELFWPSTLKKDGRKTWTFIFTLSIGGLILDVKAHYREAFPDLDYLKFQKKKKGEKKRIPDIISDNELEFNDH